MDTLKYFKQFITFPLHMDAFTDENDIIKKSVSSLPNDWINLKVSKTSAMVYKKNIGSVKFNGLGVVSTNISSIDIDDPKECIILDKLLVDCNFYVKTRKGYHFYFNKENVLERSKLCGIADINTNLLYYCPQYFHTDTNEEYNYKLIKHDKLNDMPQYAIDWCKMLISLSKNNKSKTQYNKKPSKNNIEEIIINPSLEITKFNIETIDSIITIFYESKLLDTAENWLKCAYMIRHCNNTEKAFKLFDKYSRLVLKYKDVLEIDNRKVFFGNHKYNSNFDENGILIYCSKLNPSKFKTTLQYLYVSKWSNQITKIERNYIYPNDGSNDDLFNNWITSYKCNCGFGFGCGCGYESGYKALAIKSPYGTGKTFAFKKIIDNFKFKRILFITYRQSLAYSLINDLHEKYNFSSYLDEIPNLNSSRLIIQLDSLKKLFNSNDTDIDIFSQQFKLKNMKYDLVVLDEIEGLLNHLSFSQINQHIIYNCLKDIVKSASKVLCLDGDMGDRAYDFISSVCPSYNFITNTFKTQPKHFIFQYDRDTFTNAMRDDIKNKRKICIVSMSLNETLIYQNLFKEEFSDLKVVIHNSNQKNKTILKDVNKNWALCDVLIYSPVVESGVDFNIENTFYKCYAILSTQSTSYRAFSQMLSRIRYYENNEILCLMPENMPYKVNEILYRYDEIALSKYRNIEKNELTTILIHNDTEKINSTNYFICSLIDLISNKGHTHKFLDDEPTLKKSDLCDIKGILKRTMTDAILLTKPEYDYLNNMKKRNMDMTEEMEFMMKKYMISYIWKLDTLEDVNKAINEGSYEFNLNIPSKFNRFNNIDSILSKRDNVKDKKFMTLYSFELERCKQMTNIMAMIGFVCKKNVITKIENFNTDFETIQTNLIELVKDKKFKTLFNNSRELKYTNLLKVINDTIKTFGYVLSKSKKYNPRDESKKQTFKYTYNIEFMPLIPEYIKRCEKDKIFIQTDIRTHFKTMLGIRDLETVEPVEPVLKKITITKSKKQIEIESINVYIDSINLDIDLLNKNKKSKTYDDEMNELVNTKRDLEEELLELQ